jgi:hypothetical protein
MKGRSSEALALYLFLVTVSDADGLSWYSEATLCRILSWDTTQLHEARRELCEADLVAYQKPLYQVLNLSPQPSVQKRTNRIVTGEALAVGDILKGLLAGGVR